MRFITRYKIDYHNFGKGKMAVVRRRNNLGLIRGDYGAQCNCRGEQMPQL